MSSHPKDSSKASTSKKPPKIKQACDCCHARKIRCDGASPCNNCETTSLPCTYLLIPKKKGPKGPSLRTPRAVLKMRIRQEQEHSISPDRPTIDRGSNSAASSPVISPNTDIGTSTLSFAPSFEPSPQLSLKVAEKYVNIFFKHKYPITPILHQETFCASLKQFQSSPESYGLVASLCAAMTSLQAYGSAVSSPEQSPIETKLSVDFFIKEAKHARRYRDEEDPVLSDVQTNFFLFAALFNLDRHNSAWFHLREAMTILQILRLHEENTYLAIEDELEAILSRRTFWLLFTTERAYALQRHRPLTLQRTISLPQFLPSSFDNDGDSTIISGFLDLISLFQNFDDDFVRIWNVSSQTPSLPPTTEEKSVSTAQLEALQIILATSLPDIAKRTEVQQADLLVSRQWLKTMVWQLCVAKGLLSSCSKDECMSFHYPVTIARDVAAVSASLNKESFEAHGVGILEKIFDIGCSLTDVLTLHQSNSAASRPSISAMEFGPRDYLLEMLRLLSTVLGGSSRYLPLLASKADQCLHMGPHSLIDSVCISGTPKVTELDGFVPADVDGTTESSLGGVEKVDAVYENTSEGTSGYVSQGWDMVLQTLGDECAFGRLDTVSETWLGCLSDECVEVRGVDETSLYSMLE